MSFYLDVIRSYRNPECGCQEEVLDIGGIDVMIHMERNSTGEAFINAGDWEEELRFECNSIGELRNKVKNYLESLPKGDL